MQLTQVLTWTFCKSFITNSRGSRYGPPWHILEGSMVRQDAFLKPPSSLMVCFDLSIVFSIKTLNTKNTPYLNSDLTFVLSITLFFSKLLAVWTVGIFPLGDRISGFYSAFSWIWITFSIIRDNFCPCSCVISRSPATPRKTNQINTGPGSFQSAV